MIRSRRADRPPDLGAELEHVRELRLHAAAPAIVLVEQPARGLGRLLGPADQSRELFGHGHDKFLR
ncbi:hypothetical protein BCCGELA001_22000 [Bradyrhizobium sp. CCGE-LA001]|nr:hypothetical protein BCCGELA001_22000 [Bradyrhizobium sp. CCGE-LA001]